MGHGAWRMGKKVWEWKRMHRAWGMGEEEKMNDEK